MQYTDTPRIFTDNLQAARELIDTLDPLAAPLEQATQVIGDALLAGKTLLCCGNGGSAGDAAHLTSEIANRFVLNRRGYPAIDLTAEHNAVTATLNDFPPDEVYARRVAAMGREGDVLCVFSTSGNSANILKALAAAQDRGIKTIAFLGKGGGQCKGVADVDLIVPSDVTARIQEMHLVLYHTLCEVLDPILDV